MTSRNKITFLIAMAVLLGSQPVTAAQTDNRQSSLVAETSTALEPRKGETRALQRTPNHGLRLAQDFYPRPAKSSPFSRTANSAGPPIKTVGTNLRSFGVPFKVNADDESFIEVQLYMSRDMGQTWQFYGRQTTDRQDFPFQAQEDGQYWFSLKTLDRDRRLIPEGDPQAELKIVVDTVQPKLDFRIETDAAGRVVCRWRASDENLAPESLQIFYQPVNESGTAKDWIKVPVKLSGPSRLGVYSDQIAWWPETTEQELYVAVEIRDIAGNAVQVDRRVLVPQTAWRHRSQSTAQITDPQRGSQPDHWQIRKASPDQNDAEPQTAQRPTQPRPNMICKNGICRLVPPMQQTAVGQPDDGVPASQGALSKNTKQVGSEVERADPPSPEPYGLPPRRLSDRPHASTQGNDSIVWPSDPDRWSPKNQSIVGSTMRPDPSVAPIVNPTQRNPRPVTDVPSNPSTITRQGDQVVSESSTMGKHNQYRGLDSQNGLAIQKPALLPNVAGYRGPVPGTDRYPDTGHPGFEQFGQPRSQQHVQTLPTKPAARAGQWTQPENNSNQPGYSNAGFANPRDSSAEDTSDARELNISGSRAPVQMVGTQRFRLEYGIDSIDPSGVARVDLWVTRDAGKTWNAWGNDPDNQSPFPVEVQQEGLYGFRIVVHSKDGLTGQGPSSGDDADMWITVDTKKPLTRITSVPYGRQQEAGRLVINYSVSDTSLSLRPITLAFSQNPDGPWNIIEEGVRNEGRYVWKPRSNVPDRIFLRIEALDKAGNVGVHALSQAIDVSGLVPRGTIHGVTPVGRN